MQFTKIDADSYPVKLIGASEESHCCHFDLSVNHWRLQLMELMKKSIKDIILDGKMDHV